MNFSLQFITFFYTDIFIIMYEFNKTGYIIFCVAYETLIIPVH